MAEEVALEPADGLRVTFGDEGAWRLDGELAPELASVRVVSGRAEDGSRLLLCAALPAGAAHHDEERVAAVLIDPDGAGHEVEEALVSTEYSGDGSIRRLGLELYLAGRDYPARAAADARESDSSQEGGLRRRSAVLDFRLDGSRGTAVYEIVERA